MIRAIDEYRAIDSYLLDSFESIGEKDESTGWVEEYRHNAGRMTKKTSEPRRVGGAIG